MPPDRRVATVVARITAKGAARSGAVWGAVFAVYTVVQTSTYAKTYPTVAARRELAQSLSNNAGVAALVGPARRLETVAGYTSWRLGVLSIIGAIWGLLIATRLLRGEEEAGRWELLLSGQTTRRRAAGQAIAGLGAGLAAMWVLTAAAVVGAGARASIDFSTSASLFYATAAVASAAMFMSIGVLCGQLAATRRQANELCAAIFGVSFLIRMIADSDTQLRWLRWASPLGWVEEMQPLIGTRPVALIPVVALILAALTAALVIAGRRDLGASVLARPDTAQAHTGLLNGVTGLAARLGRPVAFGWIAGLAVLGLVMGEVSRAAAKAISGSTTIEQALARLGGHRTGAESYLGLAFLIAAALIAFAAAGQIAAARGDEAEGYLDNLLVRRVDRRAWLASRLGFAVVLIAGASLAAGIAAWVGAATQNSHVAFSAMVQAGVNIAAPALFVLGVGALIYGLAPRLVAPVVYGLVAWSFIIELIGSSINLNHWLLDTAVLYHIPPVPAADLEWTPLVWLVGLGLATAGVGLIAFNRRDLASA